jgi:hypothetical protein
MSESDKPSKSKLRQAQTKHQSALFGNQVQKPTSQQAEAESKARGQSLTQAAAAKQQQLSADEARKLAELQQRSRPAPATPSPTPAPSAAPRPPAPTQTSRPPGSRRAPSPDELDRLLREMAKRSAARRGAGVPPSPRRPAPAGMPRPGEFGGERGEAGPVAEAPPPPPEVQAEEEKSTEKQAEILQELKAREQAAQADIKPIPQADQERAEEKSVEATVPIRTEGNAVSSAPLHAAIADLQVAMRAHDVTGQVTGANHVQKTMPHHPLYDPDAAKSQKKIEEK